MTQGQRVRALRNRLELRQHEVASALGLSRSAVANIERDFQKLTFAQGVKLADLFKVSLDTLAGLDERDGDGINAYEEGYRRGYEKGRSSVSAAIYRALRETANVVPRGGD